MRQGTRRALHSPEGGAVFLCLYHGKSATFVPVHFEVMRGKVGVLSSLLLQGVEPCNSLFLSLSFSFSLPHPFVVDHLHLGGFIKYAFSKPSQSTGHHAWHQSAGMSQSFLVLPSEDLLYQVVVASKSMSLQVP